MKLQVDKINKYYCACISYDGREFSGWEGSSDHKFIKDEINRIFEILKISIENLCIAGRTDTGVSAFRNYISFKTNVEIDGYKFLYSATSISKNIVFKSIDEVSEKFSARYSANFRIYHYYIAQERSFISPIYIDKAILNLENMRAAAKYLEGEHDFSSFCPKNYEKKRYRSIEHIDIQKIVEFNTNIIRIEIKAKSFMHHQVRYIVGSLLKVGKNKWTISRFLEYFHSKSTSSDTLLISASGLYLYDVIYKDEAQDE